MLKTRKCIIDNWSLKHAGFLLDNSTDFQIESDESFENDLGGLSNYINALLLYENPCYLANGLERVWTRFGWFEKNTKIFIQSLDPAPE